VFFFDNTYVFADSANQDSVVYITKIGKSYHRENCSFLRKGKAAVSLTEAVNSLTPCKICKPPGFSENKNTKAIQNSKRVKSKDRLYQVNVAEVAKYEDTESSKMLPAKVVDCIDGDTIKVKIKNPPAMLKSNETVRLIGVDTPETVHPSKDVEFFGKEAGDFTKKALFGKNVLLAFDWDLRDKYNRILCYVYTSDGNCHNANLIRRGYAHAYTRFSFQFANEFKALEQDAKTQKRGLWNDDEQAIKISVTPGKE
jgi:micrococcal nuclease